MPDGWASPAHAGGSNTGRRASLPNVYVQRTRCRPGGARLSFIRSAAQPYVGLANVFG
jgi:hypothetical protein